MAELAYTLTQKPTFRALNGRFSRATKALFKERRAQLKPEARRLIDLLQEEAPRATGEFADNLRFRTFEEAGNIGFRVSMQSPLGKFITEGTRAHPIVAKRAKALHFFIGAEEFFRFGVKHPGTKPNRFVGRGVRRWLPGARKMQRRISTRYTSELAGSRGKR